MQNDEYWEVETDGKKGRIGGKGERGVEGLGGGGGKRKIMGLGSWYMTRRARCIYKREQQR